MGKARIEIPFVDGKKLKSELDLQVLEKLGPKTEADLAKPQKKKAEKKAKPDAKKVEKVEENEESLETQLKGAATQFHRLGIS